MNVPDRRNHCVLFHTMSAEKENIPIYIDSILCQTNNNEHTLEKIKKAIKNNK